ncbi:DUF6221 family protein [Actinoplanes palleronii]|uniref:DUF6221 family protein n=1 Tax=Actinoplanes palleronii TaxID=113570 RepID=UPI0019430D90|nr:DUF6221 family protein [Actinoplanes palleronii]
MDDLIAFVRARLDEDERKIAAMEREERRVQTAPIFQSHPPNWLAGVDIFVSSKRWRAEVEAKRRILQLHDATEDPTISADAWVVMGKAIKMLALPYASHPDYREKWRP